MNVNEVLRKLLAMGCIKRHYINTVLALLSAGILFSSPVLGAGAPHSTQNAIECGSCHWTHSGGGGTIFPEWAVPTSQDIDDTLANNVCRGCHNDSDAPAMETHSSLITSTRYGNWAVECVVCHEPHNQKQVRDYPLNADNYIFYGISTAVSPMGLTQTGAGWRENAFAGLILFPKTSDLSISYKIKGNTVDTLTLADPLNLAFTIDLTADHAAGDSFIVSYGKLIRAALDTGHILTDPNFPKTGALKEVKFFRPENAGPTRINSFADGDTNYNGICEVCHEYTKHFQSDGTAPDQLHTNVGQNVDGSNCIRCHDHKRGFAHGGGKGTSCGYCHGHDKGWYQDEPWLGGRGTYQSHSTHTEDDADDVRGPKLACADCHDTDNYPLFKDGNTLATTNVCDGCHSSVGDYDGVDDPDIGAKYGNNGELKYNWRNRAYEDSDNVTLRPGMEKWCAGCHDGQNGSSVNGVAAPNVIGDESGAYTYGTGWGYYKTGHGLVGNENFPSKGSMETLAGRAVQCGACHNTSLAHVDGRARSFDCSDGCDPTEYQQSYRLNMVDGQDPMFIPWPQNAPNLAASYRLCVSCHDSGPFVDGTNIQTNLRRCDSWDTSDPANPVCTNDDYGNYHQYHLVDRSERYPADYDYSSTANRNSKITCVVCHNVHGSTRTAMVRDGSLISRTPGLEYWYTRTGISTGTHPPDPADLPLSASDGKVWWRASATNLCANCHPQSWPQARNRWPYQTASLTTPILDWTGENGYVTNGASPDAAPPGSSFIFRVSYSQPDNVLPAVIQVWIDLNDDGDYDDPGEKIGLNEADAADTTVFDGKIYTISQVVNSAGDDVINYRFYATDGSLTALGSPVQDSSIALVALGPGGSNVPTLTWTGEPGYVNDGVDPDSAAAGSPFTFRVEYTDLDNDAPFIQLWLDENLDGAYSASEKHGLAVDGGDGDYTNGELFTLTLNISPAGKLPYLFYASDGSNEATGLPASEYYVTVINTAPVLSWTGEPNYTVDGVDPGSGPAGSPFVFRVQYTHPNDVAPVRIQVWIDIDDSGSYDATEKMDLTVSGGDGDYTNGEFFTRTVNLAYVGDGTLNYRFYAEDGVDVATGEATADLLVTVTAPTGNTPPVLSWYTANCLSNGVRPATGAKDTTFDFMVSYTDQENQCADTIQVWVDENNSGAYDPLEKHELTELDPTDTDCSDGKVYQTTLILSHEADPMEYRFFATDGLEAATGSPTADSPVAVLAALKVRPSGGTGWYSTISAALDIAVDPTTIVVYPNADFTAATYAEFVDFTSNIANQPLANQTLRSACGPDLTMITNPGSTAVLVKNDNVEINGFGIRNSGTAIYINVGSNHKVKNNKLYDNDYGIYSNLAASQLSIENSEIYNNSEGIHYHNGGTVASVLNSDIHNNTTGIVMRGGTHTIADTLIRDNNTAGDGGGMYIVYDTANVTLTNVTLRDNQANNGAGIYMWWGAKVWFDRSTITGNQAAAGGGAVYVRANGVLTTLDMINTVVAGNSGGSGGGLYIRSGTISLTNVTFADNTAGYRGGGLYSESTGLLILRNSILWNNTAVNLGDNIYKDGGGAMTITDSDISTGAGFIDGAAVTAVNNIDPAVDPQFVAVGDYHIQGTSPVIDQANMAYAPDHDIDLDSRPLGSGPDMGVDEYLDASLVTVAETATAVAAGNTDIDVSMPYSGDGNTNNTYTVRYNQTGVAPWTDSVLNAANTPSPFTHTISGLNTAGDYFAQVTYNDSDGVTGLNPQIIGPITLAGVQINATTTGTPTAVPGGISGSIDISIPYTDDDNDNNTYAVSYGPTVTGTWTNWDLYIFHRQSPYQGTISGLTTGAAYYVRVLYKDVDGVNGTAEQVVGPVTVP